MTNREIVRIRIRKEEQYIREGFHEGFHGWDLMVVLEEHLIKI